MTPLMYACDWKIKVTHDKKLFELLLDKGASLAIKDKKGLTAFDHAQNNKHVIAIRLFESRFKLNKTSAAKPSVSMKQSSGSHLTFFKNNRIRASDNHCDSMHLLQ
jgi:ankyrin repeat protein